MRRLPLWIALTTALLSLLATCWASAQSAPPAPANIAEHARSLPALPREAGVVRLPLSSGWRPVRDGVALDTQGALTAKYRIATGQPAGAALVVPPGTFAGLQSLRLKARGERNIQLVIALHDAAGVVYAFPAVPVRPGNSRDTEVFVADLSYMAPASSAPDPGTFDPAGAVMVTLLDISGFMSADTPEVAWTVEGLEGVLR